MFWEVTRERDLQDCVGGDGSGVMWCPSSLDGVFA